MANKLRKKSKDSAEPTPPARPDLKEFRKEKDEAVDWKAIARDERTWKIVGSVFLLISIFLFISFTSYIFTWKEDQAVAQQGFSALLDSEEPVANLLGRLGAVISHFFIYKAFGIASFLICTFFFVVGVNLLFRRKVFSIWRNLKYVTLGLVILSVSLSFIFQNTEFAFGGAVGNLINQKLYGAVGTIGTAAILLLLATGYFIWQFNPAFNLPLKKQPQPMQESTVETLAEATVPVLASQTVNDLYAGKDTKKTNSMKGESPVLINFPDEQPLHDLKMVEKELLLEVVIPPVQMEESVPETEVVKDLMHTHDLDITLPEPEEEIIQKPRDLIPSKKGDQELELEIKAVPEKVEEEEIAAVENLPHNVSLHAGSVVPPHSGTENLAHQRAGYRSSNARAVRSPSAISAANLA